MRPNFKTTFYKTSMKRLLRTHDFILKHPELVVNYKSAILSDLITHTLIVTVGAHII